LTQRFNQLGRLLPKGDDIAIAVALDDEPTWAEAWLVLCEMAKVYAEIDTFVARHGTRKA
jgi:hypothetical protein